MRSLTNEQKIIAIVGAFAAVILLIALGVVYPTIRNVNQINDDTYQLRVFLEKRQQNASHLRNSQQKIQEIEEAVVTYRQLLFMPGDELKLITKLEGIAAQSGVEQKIINSNFDKITNRQIDLDLSLTGPHLSILRYFSELEKADYFFTFASFRLTPVTARGGETGDANLIIRLNLYVNQ